MLICILHFVLEPFVREKSPQHKAWWGQLPGWEGSWIPVIITAFVHHCSLIQGLSWRLDRLPYPFPSGLRVRSSPHRLQPENVFVQIFFMCAYRQNCSQRMEAQRGYVTSLFSSRSICRKAWTPASHLCNFLFHFPSAGWPGRRACYPHGKGSSDRRSVSSQLGLLVNAVALSLQLTSCGLLQRITQGYI